MRPAQQRKARRIYWTQFAKIHCEQCAQRYRCCAHTLFYHPNVPRTPPPLRYEGGGELAHNFTNTLYDSSITYDTINTVSHSSYCGHISQGSCDSQAHFLISNFKTHMKETYGLWGGKHPSIRAYKPDPCSTTAGQHSSMIRKPVHPSVSLEMGIPRF